MLLQATPSEHLVRHAVLDQNQDIQLQKTDIQRDNQRGNAISGHAPTVGRSACAVQLEFVHPDGLDGNNATGREVGEPVLHVSSSSTVDFCNEEAPLYPLPTTHDGPKH